MAELNVNPKIEVGISETKKYIIQMVDLIGLNQSIYLEGSSGIGKSDIVNQIASELNLELIDLRLGNQDIVSLSGIGVPNLKEKTAYFTRPDFFPPENSEKKYLLFLDEFNHASKSVFSAAYQLVLERRMNNHILPKNILIIAAGNSISDRGIAFTMPSPLTNRFLHINVIPEIEGWLEYAEEKNIDWKIRSFIKGNKEYLHKFQPNKKEDNFPTPRSWMECNKFINIEDEKFRKILLNGKLGYEAMIKVENHLKLVKNLPNIEKIINDENPKILGTTLTEAYSFSILIKNYLINNLKDLSENQLFNIFKYINEQENKEVMQFLILELSALINTNEDINKEVLNSFHFLVLDSKIQLESSEFIEKIEKFKGKIQ